MKPRTENGLRLRAHQRSDAKKEVGVTRISVRRDFFEARLLVKCSVGNDRRVDVEVSVSLDEILAWLPDLVERAREQAVSEADEALEE